MRSPRRMGCTIIRRSNTPRRSFVMVAPPKIRRFISRYITITPGSDRLKPVGIGFRPAKRASSVTGFSRRWIVRSDSAVGGCPPLAAACSSRCELMAMRARTRRSSIIADAASSPFPTVKNSTFACPPARTFAVKSAGIRTPRFALSALVGETTFKPRAPSSSRKTALRKLVSRFSTRTAGRGLAGLPGPRLAKPMK